MKTNNLLIPVRFLTMQKHFYLIVLLLLLISFTSRGQVIDKNNDSIVVSQGIFDSYDPLHCSLTFDIRKFRKEKFEDKKIPAVLIFHKNDSVSIQKDIYIQARGESRKTICYFPPIKLKLKNTSFDDPYLDRVKYQKLVTHCKSSKNHDQFLFKEYLVYKLYNVFTDKSFRVQLMKMNYIDSEDKVKTIERYAFLIEDSKVLADRNNCLLIKPDNLGMMHIEKSSMMLLSLFQFMIGNVDWSIARLHNIKLIKSNDFSQELPYTVPYDFDYAGFVDAGYAVNVLNPEISSVKTRMFVGVCFSEEEYLEMAQEFISHKNEIYTIINDFEKLESKHKKEVISYIDKFYKLIEKESFYNKYILPLCKNYDE